MAGPFVSTERFEIVVKYVEKENASGIPSLMLIEKEETEERYGDKVKKIHTQWIQPNWKETNELIRQATSFDGQAGRRELDWVLYRQLMLEKYMKTWDIVGDDGSSVPCTPESMARLDPNIASALVQGFVDRTTISEEDLGN